ncbi:ABC-F family ATP-binding cassette domain-containing protein [Helicobacter trogontum]|uniref:ABC transporter ATP-binding protein n=1 Tax=Helicobacter trogontum TaxID=50960 RepID=A0A4V6YSC1_9HELI|nr:ABC-F family ATP-binding cassette domain-containing protein [Helicobacter trogontum]MDY5185572.1 ABC-F family ATP-binding cassette domain-containing protein [Helicobacter trogontum]TLD98182.1 ABC transporter ATP-binding protein [Helicobacter trogontum]
MALLSLNEISKQYDTKILLKEAHFNIDTHEKVAIIGKNGCGKSTLLQIIEGKIAQDSGQRIVKNDIEILSLPQHISFNPNHSVTDVLENSLYGLKQAHKRLQEIMQHRDFANNTLLSTEYNMLHSYIDRHDGWDLELKVKNIMQSFGLEQFAQRLAITLSGGEQKRIMLASLLIKSADIIILDEPTNHLDVSMVAFLEDYLKNMQASIIFISHDRYFIDNVATRIVELDNAKLTNFNGGYLSYLQAKAQMLTNLMKENEALKKILKTEEQWLQKGVQARRKRNEGRKERLMQLREKVKSMPSLARSITQTLEKTLNELPKDSIKNTKKMLFELRDVTLCIHDKKLIENLNLRIMQQEKIAIVGRNGSGKSTLLNCLLYDDPLMLKSRGISFHGEILRGDIRIGYFDQHKKMLDPTKTLIETFCPNGGDRVSVRGKNMHVYGYLKSFLFPKEDLEKKIGMLSGGEQSRVALALLFSRQYDCLILDEPTNDLDIATMNILEDYLMQSQSAIIFVSHDRYFTDKIAQRLVVLQDIHDSTQQSYIITYAKYSEFLDTQAELKEIRTLQNELNKDSKQSQTKSNSNTNETLKQETKPKKLSYKDQREYDSLEEDINKLELHIKELEYKLSTPSEYEKYGIQTLSNELNEAKKVLDYKWLRYEELSMKL